jgi:hypothetical protein
MADDSLGMRGAKGAIDCVKDAAKRVVPGSSCIGNPGSGPSLHYATSGLARMARSAGPSASVVGVRRTSGAIARHPRA